MGLELLHFQQKANQWLDQAIDFTEACLIQDHTLPHPLKVFRHLLGIRNGLALQQDYQSWSLRNIRAGLSDFYNQFSLRRREQMGSVAKMDLDQLVGCCLVVPRMPGHLVQIEPVMDLFEKTSGIKCVYGLLGKNMQEPVKATGRDCFSVYQQFGTSRVDSAKESLILYRKIKSALKKNCFEGFESQESAKLIDSTLKQLRVLLPEYFDLGGVYQELFQALRPKILLVGNPYSWEGRLATMISNFQGIPSASIEHGTITKGDYNWKDLAVSRVCVWGDVSKKALLANGIEADRIVVTGSPGLDGVFDQMKKERQRVSHIVLVATSGPGDLVSPDEHRQFIRLLAEAVQLAPEIDWIIKLHPKDSRDHYALVQADNLKIYGASDLSLDQNIFYFLNKSFCLVTVASTAAIDAMISNVPVITVGVGEQTRDKIEYIEAGCSIHIRSAAELLSHVRKLKTEGSEKILRQSVEHFLGDYFKNRGFAAQSVATELSKLVEGSRHANVNHDH